MKRALDPSKLHSVQIVDIPPLSAFLREGGSGQPGLWCSRTPTAQGGGPPHTESMVLCPPVQVKISHALLLCEIMQF